MVAILLAGCASAQSSKLKSQNNTHSADWDLIKAAYTFAFPLVMMDATATVSTNTVQANSSKAPYNQFIHSSHLADADAKDVVTPNVDIIYKQVFFDLRDDAYVFHKPAADRFFSVEMLDFYTNSIAILGIGGDTQDARTYLITAPDFAGEVPADMTLVSMPANNAWMLARTDVLNQDDMTSVFDLQSAMKLVPLSAYLEVGFDYDAPQGTLSSANEFIPIEHVLQMTPEEFFNRANELMLTNPPATADASTIESFAQIGVGPGLQFDPSVLWQNSNKMLRPQCLVFAGVEWLWALLEVFSASN